MTHSLLSLLPLGIYAASAALLHRTVPKAPEAVSVWPAVVATAGAIVHGVLVFGAIHTPEGPVIAITDSASLVGFVIAFTTVLLMASTPLAMLPAVLLLLAGVLGIGTGLASGFQEVAEPAWEITAHITLAALAAGWLSMAAAIVLLLAWQQQRLRARTPLGILSLLPPVEAMERTLFLLIGGGFAVLTLVLVTGFFFVYDPRAQHLVHKMVLAVTAWAVFGVLLFGRVRYGWRGRKALQFTMVGFVSLILAYFGSKFVLETLLGLHWG